METQSTSVNNSRATRWRLLALGAAAVAVGVLAALLIVLDDGADGDSPATVASTDAAAAESDQTTSSAASGSTQDTVEIALGGDAVSREDSELAGDTASSSEGAQAGADPAAEASPTDQASPGDTSDQANLALIELSGSLQVVAAPVGQFGPSEIPDFDPASWRFDLIIDPTSATVSGTVSIPDFEGSGVAETQVGVGPYVAATLGGLTLSFTDAAIVDAPGPVAIADAAVQTRESVPFTVTWACGLVTDDASVLTGRIGITIGPESIFLSAGIHLTASDYQDFPVTYNISFGFRPTEEQRLQIERMLAQS